MCVCMICKRIVLHSVKWFQVLLSNTNNSIWTQLIGFKYYYLMHIIELSIDNDPLVQLAGAVEYNDSSEGQDPPNEFSGYDN